jgi:hypothetical protein
MHSKNITFFCDYDCGYDYVSVFEYVIVSENESEFGYGCESDNVNAISHAQATCYNPHLSSTLCSSSWNLFDLRDFALQNSTSIGPCF